MPEQVERLRQAALRLIVENAEQSLPGTGSNARHEFPIVEVGQLLLFASWLALTDNPRDRELAYEVATRLATRKDLTEHEFAACSEVLNRLGNFPALNLATKQNGDFGPVVPLLFAIESSIKKAANTITVGNRKVILTDFQISIEQSLKSNNRVVSVSAPTSAGKSFLLCIDLVRRFAESESIKYICYVVPTRALSRQIAEKIRAELQTSQLRDVGVRVLPPKNSSDIPQRAVFVFTQERLLSLLSDPKAQIDMLYVDEAQGIADGGRGVLLQQAIERTLRTNPKCKIVIVAPMVRNPEAFARFIGEESGSAIPYAESLVTQNVFMVETVARKTKRCKIGLKQGSEWVDLGVRDLSYPFRADNKSQGRAVANFAIDVTRGNDVTLIFSSGAKNAEKIAIDIAGKLPEAKHDSLHELATFIREEIHSDYPLATTLRKGVAFHYSMMPSIVRARIEEMAENGEIQYITATTTLLSGVNLPLKNLVISSPRKGNDVLSGFEFWNLAGRAGRLGKEFQGNIWVLKLTDWPSNVYESDMAMNVVASFENVLRESAEAVLQTLADRHAPVDDTNTLDTAAAKVFYDSATSDIPFSRGRFGSLVPPHIAREIDGEVSRLREQIPGPMMQAAPGVSPARVAWLWEELQSKEVEYLIPLHPRNPSSYNRLQDLMALLQRTLSNDESARYKYYTFVAHDWMNETPLHDMIMGKIGWDNRHNEEKSVSDSIRDLLDVVERQLRFSCSRNFKILTAGLEVLCADTKKEYLLDRIAPISMFLDSGASSEEVITLLGLGLSRTSAIKVATIFRSTGSKNVIGSITNPRDQQDLARRLPPICMDEVRRVFRGGI